MATSSVSVPLIEQRGSSSTRKPLNYRFLSTFDKYSVLHIPLTTQYSSLLARLLSCWTFWRSCTTEQSRPLIRYASAVIWPRHKKQTVLIRTFSATLLMVREASTTYDSGANAGYRYTMRLSIDKRPAWIYGLGFSGRSWAAGSLLTGIQPLPLFEFRVPSDGCFDGGG